MFTPVARALAVVSASLALLPGQSQACWFTDCFKCCKPKAQTTYCAPACEVCPQQVNYVPQTCFRTVTQCVPCTTMKPECSIDPCTGCPVTVMRPVTTMVQRQVQVPYTTFRPVVTPVATCPSPCATGACGGGTNYYTPSTATFGTSSMVAAPAMSTPGCTNCASGASYAAPATTYSTPAPAATYSTPMNGGTYNTPTYTTPSTSTPTYSSPSTTTQPSLPPAGSGSPTPATTPMSSSYPSGNTLAPPAANVYRPVPDMQQYTDPKANAPRLLDPNNRTTVRPMPRTAVLPAIFQSSQRPEVQPVSNKNASDDQWTAAARLDDGWKPMGGR